MKKFQRAISSLKKKIHQGCEIERTESPDLSWSSSGALPEKVTFSWDMTDDKPAMRRIRVTSVLGRENRIEATVWEDAC